MASSSARSDLTRALLEDNNGVEPESGALDGAPDAYRGGFLGVASDEGSDEEDDALESTPVIMGSPFPYFFGGPQKPPKRKASIRGGRLCLTGDGVSGYLGPSRATARRSQSSGRACPRGGRAGGDGAHHDPC